MKFFQAQTTIQASPETIWSILTDAASFPSWDRNIIKLEGNIAPGAKLKAFPKFTPGRSFAVRVSTFEPGKKMVWSGGMPLGLFTGERTFTLTPAENGATRFTLREEFTGLLLPLIGKSLPNLTPVFEEFAADLKSRAESRRS